MPSDGSYTVVITSCGRFDLLRRTVTSLAAHLDAPPERVLVLEDSGDATVADALAGVPLPFDVVLHRERLGQMRSIDVGYGRVETPYIFHCEDDWTFFRDGFVAQSIAVLAACPTVSMVGLRPRAELNPLVRSLPATTEAGVPVIHFDPALHPEYFSYSFNPGMRRLADYRRLGPFTPLGYEPDVSYAFKKAGFHTATLADPAVRHIGDGRHVLDPHQPKRPANLIERLQRSVEKRVKRIRRARLGRNEAAGRRR